MPYQYWTLVILFCIQNTASQNLFDLLGGLGVNSAWGEPGPAHFDPGFQQFSPQRGLRPHPRHGIHGHGQSLGAPTTTSPFGVSEEQMAEILSESSRTNPERQRLDTLIQNSGGQFTGNAAPFNYLIQDYIATSPGPITETPLTTPALAPEPKPNMSRRAKKPGIPRNQAAAGPLGFAGGADGTNPNPNQNQWAHPQSQIFNGPPPELHSNMSPSSGHQTANTGAVYGPPPPSHQNSIDPSAGVSGTQSAGSGVIFGPPPPSVQKRLRQQKNTNSPAGSVMGLSDGRVRMRTGSPGKSIAAERLAVIQRRIDSMTNQQNHAAARHATPAEIEKLQNEIDALNRLQTKLRGGATGVPAPPPHTPNPGFAGTEPAPANIPYKTNTGLNAAFIDHNFRQTFGTMMSQAMQGKQPTPMSPVVGPNSGYPNHGIEQGPNNVVIPAQNFGPPTNQRPARRNRPQRRQKQQLTQTVEGGIVIAPPVKGSTVKPPAEGDVRIVNGVKFVFSDVDGFDTFQWAKAPPGHTSVTTTTVPAAAGNTEAAPPA